MQGLWSLTFANLQGSRVQIYEGTSESCVLATFRGNVCETSVRVGVCTYPLLLVWQNEPCAGGIEVVGLPVRQSGGEVPASSVRGLQSAVHGLRRAVEERRTTNGSADAGAAVLLVPPALLLGAGAGRWIYGMQMRQVRRFGALDSKNDLQKDFYHKEHQTHIDRICNASITRHPPWKKRSARSRLLLLA